MPRGTQHFAGAAQNSERCRPAAVVEMFPDGNRPANAMQFAKHLQLSQRNAQPRQCCVPPCRVHCRVIPLCRVIWLVLWGVRKTDTGRLAPFRFYSSGDTALCRCGSKFRTVPSCGCCGDVFRRQQASKRNAIRKAPAIVATQRTTSPMLCPPVSSPLSRLVGREEDRHRTACAIPLLFFRGHSTLWVRLKIPKGAVPAAVVEMFPDGNRPANATQFAKHLQLSQRNAQPR